MGGAQAFGDEELAMTVTVTLELDDATWQRAHKLAELQRQNVADLLVGWLAETLPPPENGGAPASADNPEDVAVEREMEAYIALHPQLKQHFLGQFVAIFGGKLVDHDADYGALFDRVDAKFPDEFVWLTRVETEPIKTFIFRSPRLELLAE